MSIQVRSPDLKSGIILDCLNCWGITPSLKDLEKIICKGFEIVSEIFFIKADEIPSESTVFLFCKSSIVSWISDGVKGSSEKLNEKEGADFGGEVVKFSLTGWTSSTILSAMFAKNSLNFSAIVKESSVETPLWIMDWIELLLLLLLLIALRRISQVFLQSDWCLSNWFWKYSFLLALRTLA